MRGQGLGRHGILLRLDGCLHCSLSQPLVDLLLEGDPVVLVLLHSLLPALLQHPLDHRVQSTEFLVGTAVPLGGREGNDLSSAAPLFLCS